MKLKSMFNNFSIRTKAILITLGIATVIVAIGTLITFYPIILGIILGSFFIGLPLYGIYVNVEEVLRHGYIERD
jgi:hypothetical protein